MTVVLVGSMNMDITVSVPNIPKPGETILGQDLFQAPGGKGSNQAAAAAKAGSTPVLIACVGNDSFGDSLLEEAEKNGVDTQFVVRSSRSSSGVALIAVDKNAENSIVVASGANGDLDVEHIFRALDNFSKSEVISVTLEIKLESAKAALLKTRELGATSILNLSPVTAEARSLAPLANFLIINESEAAQILESNNLALADLATGFRRLNCQHVIVTLGGKGVVYFDASSENSETRHFQAVSITPVDTTGCGDAFTGSFASELDSGKSIAESIEFGIRAAGFAAMSVGAQSSYGTREQVLAQ